MSGIEDLRQRTMAAEKRFCLINETHAKYSERLISLMNAVESRILEQRDEIARHSSAHEHYTAKIEHSEQDNEQLRTMLHSLLQAIEADSQDKLAEAMQLLDQKASALVGAAVEDETPTEVAAAPEPEMDAAPEPVAEAASDVAAESIEQAPEELAAEAVEEPETAAVEDAAEPAAESEGSVEEVLFSEPDEAAAMAEAAADADAQAEPQTAEGEEAVPESSLVAIMQRVSKLVDEKHDTAETAEKQAPAAKKQAPAAE